MVGNVDRCSPISIRYICSLVNLKVILPIISTPYSKLNRSYSAFIVFHIHRKNSENITDTTSISWIDALQNGSRIINISMSGGIGIYCIGNSVG